MRVVYLVILTVLLGISSPIQAKKLKNNHMCVFDPVGKTGEAFTAAKDIITDFLPFGVRFKLYLYTTEASAKSDFKNGLCDAVVITGGQLREFNLFSSTIEAMGGVQSYDDLGEILRTLMSPRAQDLFTQGDYEIAGIYPVGAAYFHVKDKDMVNVSAFKSKNMFVLREDPVSQIYANVLGSDQVPGSTSNFAHALSRGKSDATFLPAILTQALEIDKAVEKGGIVRFPLFYFTLQLLIKKDNFPEGFGQKAREISYDFFDKAVSINRNAEENIPEELWLDPTPEQTIEWELVQAQVRDEALKKELYDQRMLKIMKKVRCRKKVSSPGCNLTTDF